MAKFGINDILNAKTKAAGQQAQGYKEIYLSPYEVKAAEENTHQKLEGIEELADSFLHVGQEQPTVFCHIHNSIPNASLILLNNSSSAGCPISLCCHSYSRFILSSIMPLLLWCPFRTQCTLP